MTNSVFATNGLAGAGYLLSGPQTQRLGQQQEGTQGTFWEYCLAPAGITGPGYAVLIDTSFNATMATTALAGAPGRGGVIGIAPIAMAAGDYGWFQRMGPANVMVAAGTAAKTRLNTTATPGVLGTDATAGSAQIEGLTLVAAQATLGLAAVNSGDDYTVTGQN